MNVTVFVSLILISIEFFDFKVTWALTRTQGCVISSLQNSQQPWRREAYFVKLCFHLVS